MAAGKPANMRILIAEDDPALAGFVRKGLEAEHYAVDVSSDGEQAHSLATEFDYDLIVLDLTLPRLDGVTILKQVRSRKPNVAVLILTARGRVEDRVLCLDAGADDYMVKSCSFAELSARIRALLRRNRLPMESASGKEFAHPNQQRSCPIPRKTFLAGQCAGTATRD